MDGDYNFSGHPAPVLGHPHCTELLRDVQSEPPAFQFVPSISFSGTGHHWEETGSVLSVPFLWVITMTSVQC